MVNTDNLLQHTVSPGSVLSTEVQYTNYSPTVLLALMFKIANQNLFKYFFKWQYGFPASRGSFPGVR